MLLIVIALAGLALGFFFPAHLINAIREKDEEKARKEKVKACIYFGLTVVSVLILLSSN